MTTATETPNLAAATETPAEQTTSTTSTDNFSESNFQAYKDAENREALEKVSGKLPTRATSPQSSGSAPETEDTTGTNAELPPAEGTRADLPPAQPQKTKTKEDTRREFEKLTTSNRELKAQTDALQKKLDELTKAAPTTSTTQPPPARTPELQPAPAAAKVTRPEPTKDDVDPKTGQKLYPTFGDLHAAQREWDREQTLAQLKAEQSKTESQRAKQEQDRIISEGFQKKLEPARKKYADFDKVALSNDVYIPEGSVPDLFILDSEHAGDVMYYLGQHPELLKTFYETASQPDGSLKITKNLLHPMRQHRALLEIEATFAKPASATSARKTSAAPAPPHEVSGQGSVPPDEVEQALTDDDFTAYKNAENRAALAKAKGR